MKLQITQGWLSFVFHYCFEDIQFCWKAQGAFLWRQVTFWASLQWYWVSHHNHLQNFIVQLGCLLVVTKQKFIAFQGTVTRREDQSKACVKTIQTWSQDPLYKQTYQYKMLNLLSQKILPPNWSHSLPFWHNWSRIQSPVNSRVEFPLISKEPGSDPRSRCHTAAKPSRVAVYPPTL